MFQPGLPEIGWSAAVAGGATSNPQSVIAVQPLGSFGHAAGGGRALVTVRPAVPLWPSLVAAMVTVPAASAVANPVPETVAMTRLLDVHVTVRPLRRLPPASRSVVVNGSVPPNPRLAL